MKKVISIFILCFTTLPFSAFSQIIVNSSGNVGINKTNPIYRLDVKGGVRINSYGADYIFDDFLFYPSLNYATLGTSNKRWGHIYSVDATFTYTPTIDSDEKFKTDIRNFSDVSDQLNQLRAVKYKLKPEFIPQKEGKPTKDNGDLYGFIAQEMQKVFPDIVTTREDSSLGIRYGELIPVLVKAFQEQQAQIEELKGKIAAIETNCCNNSLEGASRATGITNNISEDKARLDQNVPNPFNSETNIGCFIPEEAITSVLYIYNMNGTQLQQYSINGKSKQSVTINGNSFTPGMYLYALVIDGREVDMKRMVLTD